MMVIRRVAGQTIHVGEDIRIVIVKTETSGRTHLGIEAPMNVPIHRLEIFEKIRSENYAAISGNALGWLQGAANE